MTIYTIGYEKRNIQEYIEILKKARVQTLIDVRETAWSYKRDFCKVKFNSALSAAGIEYVHLKELGNPKKFRKNYSPADTILKKYKTYLEKTQSGIPALLNLIVFASFKNENVCLTCFEKDHRTCHRSIITECITNTFTVKIVHL